MDENNEPKIERIIAKYHHRLELVRTIVPLCVLVLQVMIACKLFHVDIEHLVTSLHLGFITLPQ